jgi:flavin-dependent dehydrogenase
MEQISQASYTQQMLGGARLVSGPFVVKDWSYLSETVVGDGYILVGDAACFIDPLFSSGVHLALLSGVLAAAYVTSALKDPDIAKAAGRVYHELYYKEYSHFREMAKLFYSSNRTVESYFWEARRILESDASLSPRHAFVQAVAGQPPRGYERAVLERGKLSPELAASIGQVQGERAWRRNQFQGALTR